MASASCRFCGSSLHVSFVDLGMSPLCETYLSTDQLNSMEPFFPLHVYVCSECLLVQLEEYVAPAEIFGDYPYFSSYSDSWLRHAKRYVEAISGRLTLHHASFVVELGSNDGYLLQYFVANGVPALGVEPAKNVAQEAVARGVATKVAFFGDSTAQEMVAERGRADLIIGNNVLAQVPDLNGFVEGMRILLGPGGTITMEFPHLVRLVEERQFDTIYHEHFSYFSLLAAERIFAEHGLTIYDVELLASHGGSLRIYARHRNDNFLAVTDAVSDLRTAEDEAGLSRLDYYTAFEPLVERTKRDLLDFLIWAKRDGKTIVGYGAPGKGNTLLNYCGIRTDFLEYTVDRNPYKQGRFLPGTHIPIHHPDRISETRPDFVLILPWNLKSEIMKQMSFVRQWGARFVVPIPRVEVHD